jgi:surface protein
MGKVFIQESTLTSIGSAIREKTGKTDLIAPGDMPREIRAIVSGGGDPGEHPTDAELTFTGAVNYTFANNKWNWVINAYGNRIVVKDVTQLEHMFYASTELEEIPFDIVGGNSTYCYNTNVFCDCYNLKSTGKLKNWRPAGGASMFSNCYRLRELNAENWDWSNVNNVAYQALNSMFQSCYSLRRIPEDVLKGAYNAYSSYYGSQYADMFNGCYCLDEIRGVPVTRVSASSNLFNNTFKYCCRAKNIIFDMNDDGTPIEVNWSNQTIDLTTVGYVTPDRVSFITGYNSGITADKEYSNSATYNALKDDPDNFTRESSMSRYDGGSAVRTLYSLPSTSGTGCVIKFKSNAGASTVIGRPMAGIEEQFIAAAAAKGWTVSYGQ